VWNFVNSFVEFNRYTNSPVARIGNELYNMPFNMNTFAKIWDDVFTPEDALRHINEEKKEIQGEPKNLEEQAISLVGRTIYEKLIKGYTEKQWGKKASELPTSIINRLPVRFTYDNNYFNDIYQGIPIEGYTKIIEKMLEGIDLKLNCDFFDNINIFKGIADKIIFTGPIDQYYNYKYGKLEYRSLRFQTEELRVDNYQGNAVVNYTDDDVPYTRIIEHKHFEYGKSLGKIQTDSVKNRTIITKEYPVKYEENSEPYYTINDEKNMNIYLKYKELADKDNSVIFGGRLGQYKYFDMDEIIEEALKLVEQELK